MTVHSSRRAYATRDVTSNYILIRAKDHEKSLAFYKDVMGMKLKRVSENAGAKFNLYFLKYG
ncbi:hypothetical protein B0H14DRAFT_3451931 [Mycena olivaceomarginata]|nr:hypothetical protein B0H14DRAFT_3451931 [Mycena olivaceomarginata]